MSTYHDYSHDDLDSYDMDETTDSFEHPCDTCHKSSTCCETCEVFQKEYSEYSDAVNGFEAFVDNYDQFADGLL